LQTSKNVTNQFSEFRRLLDERLRSVFTARPPAILYEPIQYVLDGDGKRIRPILLILSCQAVGGQLEDCVDAALAVELLHNFTLVHDDIMDGDDTRRGRPTVHKKWDTDTALLAGDGLVALAYQSLFCTKSPKMDEVARIFTDGIVEICEGQALDREFETRRDVSIAEYLVMIGKKTASLLTISAKIGALLGRGSASEVCALGEFARHLGLAFQIQDDLLDITSSQEVTGKPFGSDVIRKKQTYLLVHALTHGDSDVRRRLNEILDSTIAQAHVHEVKTIFEKSGSLAAAETAVHQYLTAAQRQLDNLPSTPAKEQLASFLAYISNRKA
jgi:geranylgeranyl diphosphate synthase type II